MNSLEQALQQRLTKRVKDNSLRTLQYYPSLIDFCSNDYLGLARSADLKQQIRILEDSFTSHQIGATGSRLIAGQHPFYDLTEELIAQTHEAEAALLFNSGYSANLSVLSCLPQRGDTVIYDELSHACIKDGIRLSLAERFAFKHNDLEDLERRLKRAKGTIFVIVESIYSMDGDKAPLMQMANLASYYGAHLIVDEAHSTGIVGDKGQGLVNSLGLSKLVFCRIHTYGKAMGCHGAAVVGSQILKQYLINFARPFVFTTALPLNNIASIYASYIYLNKNLTLIDNLNHKINLFRKNLNIEKLQTIFSQSPIQIVLISGNDEVRKAALQLRTNGFDVRAILSPTVKKGQERLRICLHAFNSDDDIYNLVQQLNNF